jgi:hypothetical protein
VSLRVFQRRFRIVAYCSIASAGAIKGRPKAIQLRGPVAESRHGHITRQRQRGSSSSSLQTDHRQPLDQQDIDHPILPNPPNHSVLGQLAPRPTLLVQLCSSTTLSFAPLHSHCPCLSGVAPSLRRFRNPATNEPYKALSTRPATILIHPPTHCSALLFAAKPAPVHLTPSCTRSSINPPRPDILIELATSGRGRSKHSELSPWVTA